MRFRTTTNDTSLFNLRHPCGLVIILLYVDDIVNTGSSSDLISIITKAMHQNFQLKDLGPLHYFLGIEVLRTSSRLLLQSKYTEKLLTRAGMAESKTAPTPMAVRSLTNSNNRLFDNPTLYRSIVGGLHYLAVTRPEIQYIVNSVSQSMHDPTEQNFQSLKQILRYLKGSSRCGLLFQK